MRLLVTALATGISVVMGLAVSVAFGQEHSAHWYNKEAASGKFSVILNVPDGTEAIVAVAREKGIDTTVVGIGMDLTFQRKVLSCSPPSCWPPSILLGIDKNMNGRYEADDFAWQWSLASGGPGGADPALLHGDTFLQCEAPAPLLSPDPNFVSVNAYTTYFCYSPDLLGTDYAPTYAVLLAYQTGAGGPAGIMPTSSVLALKVLAGGSSSWTNFNALVDRVTMGDNTMPTTRIDEPNNSRAHFEVMTAK